MPVASGLGLWVLFEFEGPPTDRVWRVYTPPSGAPVGAYAYSTGRHYFAGHKGQARDWREAMELAASGARRRLGGQQ